MRALVRATRWVGLLAMVCSYFVVVASAAQPSTGPQPSGNPLQGHVSRESPAKPAALATWEANMLKHGDVLCQRITANKDAVPADGPMNEVFYDGTRVFYQIADYTKDAKWNACAEVANYIYRDRYVMKAVHSYTKLAGSVVGHINFTKGLRMHFERTGDVRSKEAVLLMVTNAAGASATPAQFAQVTRIDSMREMSYYLHAHIDAEALGAPKRPRHKEIVDRLFQYLDSFVTPTTWGNSQVAPFMAGLVAEALLREWDLTKDPRTVPALTKLADFLWADAWHAPTESMLYAINPHPQARGGTRSGTGAADLNLLIAPLYAWLWAQTGDVAQRDRADQMFAGAVAPRGASTLHLGKQFCQNYRWSFDFVKWRGW